MNRPSGTYGCSGVAKLLNSLSFPLIPYHFSRRCGLGAPPSSSPSPLKGEGICRGQGCEVPRLRRERRSLPRERRGEVNLGPIWPWLASFTPSGEAGNEAAVASFGAPLTRTPWATRLRLWPWLASSGVGRSGETFNSVSFRLISSHSYRLCGRWRRRYA